MNEEIKIVITFTEPNGRQTSINADYFLGSVHAVGSAPWESQTICLGSPDVRQIAASRYQIADVIFRMAEKIPGLHEAILAFDERNITSHPERFEVSTRIRRETTDE